MKKVLTRICGNIATSLKKEYNKDFEREEIMVKMIEKIEKMI